MTIEQVLLPTDLGQTTKDLVPHAIRFTSLLGAQLHVVHVVAPIDHFSTVYLRGTSITKMESMLRRKAYSQMTAFSRTWFGDIGGLKTAVLFGDVAQELLRYVATESISMIIMGSHAHAGLSRFMHGSVSDQVARRCRVPVMVINVSPDPLSPHREGPCSHPSQVLSPS